MKSLILLLSVCAASAAQAQRLYTSSIVQAEQGAFVPYALNNSGTVAGAWYQTNIPKAAYWKSSAVSLLPPINNNSAALAVSDNDLFAGRAEPNSVLWTFSEATAITNGEAYGINDSGWVVGSRSARAYLWRDGVTTVFPLINNAAGIFNQALAVNNDGMVVGYERHVEGNLIRNWFWTEASGLQEIVTPGGGRVWDVSSTGMIAVGRGVWANGTYTALPDCFAPKRINGNGDVIGQNELGAYFLWSSGIKYDLSTLLAPGFEMQIDGAIDINDNGQILVGGTRNGQSNYYILNPVPEPASMLALGGGVALLFRRRTRRRAG